jgi:predicted O-methyltransferase YrrM
MRFLSADAAERFADESLDFVYIDANHAEPYVRQDIELWYAKIKPDGIIAGHDIINGEIMGVQRAVHNEIFEKRGLDVFLIQDPAWSWYAVKK